VDPLVHSEAEPAVLSSRRKKVRPEDRLPQQKKCAQSLSYHPSHGHDEDDLARSNGSVRPSVEWLRPESLRPDPLWPGSAEASWFTTCLKPRADWWTCCALTSTSSSSVKFFGRNASWAFAFTSACVALLGSAPPKGMWWLQAGLKRKKETGGSAPRGGNAEERREIGGERAEDSYFLWFTVIGETS
jgi:hypothetical protein